MEIRRAFVKKLFDVFNELSKRSQFHMRILAVLTELPETITVRYFMSSIDCLNDPYYVGIYVDALTGQSQAIPISSAYT